MLFLETLCQDETLRVNFLSLMECWVTFCRKELVFTDRSQWNLDLKIEVQLEPLINLSVCLFSASGYHGVLVYCCKAQLQVWYCFNKTVQWTIESIILSEGNGNVPKNTVSLEREIERALRSLCVSWQICLGNQLCSYFSCSFQSWWSPCPPYML